MAGWLRQFKNDMTLEQINNEIIQESDCLRLQMVFKLHPPLLYKSAISGCGVNDPPVPALALPGNIT